MHWVFLASGSSWGLTTVLRILKDWEGDPLHGKEQSLRVRWTWGQIPAPLCDLGDAS